MSPSTRKSKRRPLQDAKKTPRLYIDPSEFYLMRRRAFLSTQEAAAYLDVSHRTILNWEKGRSPIPFMALKVLKMKAGYVLSGEHFAEWFVRDDTLWSPEGRAFKPHELRYIANYFWMARQWLAERAKERKCQNQKPNAAITASAAASVVSPALSPDRHLPQAGTLRHGDFAGTLTTFGAEPRRDMPQKIDDRIRLQEKPKGFDAFLAKLLEFET